MRFCLELENCYLCHSELHVGEERNVLGRKMDGIVAEVYEAIKYLTETGPSH